MRTATEIFDDVMAACDGDYAVAKAALEDGQYLADAGYTDDDQEAIEEAHDRIKKELERCEIRETA